MEGRPCPICGNADRNRFRMYYDGPQKLYRCFECDHVAEYAGPGRSAYSLPEDEYAHLSPDAQGWVYAGRERVLRDIAQRIKGAGGSGALLDVGCGDGHFMAVCQEVGFECHGVERSQRLASRVRGADMGVTHGTYDAAMFESGSFDVVAFIQVLEHVREPRPLLRAAHEHLRPGGVLCIEVPSRTAPHFLLYQATRARRLIDSPRGVIRQHVNYFHPASMRRITSSEGFVQSELVTGRWATKYHGWKHVLGAVIDPLANKIRVGGILYLGSRA